MAFHGRMNNEGKLIQCELLTGHSQCQVVPMRPHHEHIEDDGEPMCAIPPRTYVKTYSSDQGLRRSKSCLTHHSFNSRTVRYMGTSASSNENSELNSITEIETLRDVTPRGTRRSTPETETETETLCCETALSQAFVASDECYDDDAEQYPNDEASLEKCSTNSIHSWEALYADPKPAMAEDLNSDIIVPSLDLGSDTSSREYAVLMGKMKAPEDAYENWLSAKLKQKEYKKQAERERSERLEEQATQRKEAAQKRYMAWCEEKKRQALKAKPKKVQSAAKTKPKDTSSAEARIYNWEMQKRKEAEQQRQLRLIKERQWQLEQKQREMRNQQAFQQWMKDVAQKPKPVPLNQGLKSLRGTVSSIYINPKEWVN